MVATLGTESRVQQGSDAVIPAVPGEFYAYAAQITGERPLYVLMKCKANKSRPLVELKTLGREANLLFMFHEKIQVSAVKAAQAFGLLGNNVEGEIFDEMWIAPASITTDEFYSIQARHDRARLVEVAREACAGHETSLDLAPTAIVAMVTSAGKYGLFVVKGMTPTSVQIDACHILL